MGIKEYFPDGSLIDNWFSKAPDACLNEGVKKYIVTDYVIKNDGVCYTEQFQKLIDKISDNGGGILVIPKGTFITGALFFKRNVNLYIEKDGVLKGSDNIADYPICETRIEGESCLYFPALINADSLDGF